MVLNNIYNIVSVVHFNGYFDFVKEENIMKNNLGRAMSLILTVVMILTSLTCVSFAQTETEKEALAKSLSWSEDFENADFSNGWGSWEVLSTNDTNDTKIRNDVYHESDGSYISLKKVNGVFGKNADDESIKFGSHVFGKSISADRDGNAYPDAIAWSKYLRLYHEENATAAAMSKTDLGTYSDAAVHYSCEIALENMYSTDRTYSLVYTFYSADDSVASVTTKHRTRVTLAKFTGNSNLTSVAMTAFGTETDIAVSQQKWHKLDFVLYADLGMDLYIDGVKVNQERYYSSATGSLRAFGTMAFYGGYNLRSSTYGSPASPLYLDNVSTTLCYGEPQISENADYDTNKIYIDMENSEDVKGGLVSEAALGNSYPANKKVITFNAVSDIFGKSGRAFELSNENLPLTKTDDACSPYIQIGRADSVSPGTSSLSAGDKVRISFNMANKHLTNAKHALISGDGIASGGFKFKTDGEVTLFGNTMANLDVKQNKWYNFDIIITVGDTASTADLYINGTKAGETVTASKDGSNITSVKYIRIGYDGTKDTGVADVTAFKTDGMYVDDVIFEYYPADGEALSISPVDIICSGGTAADELSAAITPADSATVGQTKATIKINGASSFEFVDEQGRVKSDADAAEGGYVVINTNDGKTLVYESLNWQPLDSTDFDSVVLNTGSATILPLQSGSWKVNNEKENHTYETVGALGAKPEADKALAILTDGTYTSTTRDPYLFYALGDEAVSREFTTEFSVFHDGKHYEKSIMLVGKNGSTNIRKSVVIFKADNRILVNGENIGAWKGNRWYRIAINFNPDSGNGTLYLNGKAYPYEISNFDTLAETVLTSFRVISTYPSGTEVKGTIAVDDFSFYYGGYLGDEWTTSVSVADADSVLIDDGCIYTKDDITLNTLDSKLNCKSDATKVYTDATYATEHNQNDKFTNETVLVEKSGLFYNYYTVKNLDSQYKPSIYIDGVEVTELDNGSLTAKVCTDTPAQSKSKLIVAVYNSGELTSLKVCDIKPGFNVTESEAITISGSLSGVSVKAIVIESLDTPNPLTRFAEK